MKSSTFRLSLLSAALAPCIVHAAGFGEIIVHSRVGEPLRAEVPIIAHPGESLETACFSLAPVQGADLPVVTSAKARLIRSGNGLQLIITGSKPITEPIFIVAIQASCGIDLQRDYILMPQAPQMLAETTEPNLPMAAGPGGGDKRSNIKYREIFVHQGDTLESIAEAQAPSSLSQQRRLISAMKRANPGVYPEQALPEGTVLRLPERPTRIAAERDELGDVPTQEDRQQPSASAPSRPKPAKIAKPRPTTPQVPATDKGSDRLLLSAAEEIAKPTEKRGRTQTSLAETEDHMVKLESTIQQLTQEIDKMNVALAMAKQAIQAQQQLQQAQAALAQAGQLAIPAPPPAPQKKSEGGWLELLLSALGGGAIAVGLASFLARRKDNPIDGEAPLAMSGYRPEAQARPAPSVPPAAAAPR